MAEIKHTFQAGKMNKDLDERLVPQGEYRDALNIEVRTSDGSDVGAVQNLYANVERLAYKSESIDATENRFGVKSSFIGSIANEKTNKSYFFIASPPKTSLTTEGGISLIDTVKVYKDMIIEYDNIERHILPVVTDIFYLELPRVKFSTATGSSTTGFNYVDVVSDTVFNYVRVGMTIKAYSSSTLDLFTTSQNYTNSQPLSKDVKIIKVDKDNKRIYFDREVLADLNNCVAYTLQAPHTLNFYRDNINERRLITGINIIDNLLFWTDDYSEPKKINIDRCRAYHGVKGPEEARENYNSHTGLMVSNPTAPKELIYVADIQGSTDYGYLQEEHITVIKKSPKTALNLVMSENEEGGDGGVNAKTALSDNGASLHDEDGDLLTTGDVLDVIIKPAIFTQGEELTFTAGSMYAAVGFNAGLSFTATVVSFTSPNIYSIEIKSINTNITSGIDLWDVSVDQRKPLFELKLVRFSYRYKYQDGEYSTFAPWSELAFLPGDFDYVPKKGYNLGMVNNLRNLVIKDFIVEDDQRPDDVVGVDILYKDTVSPNVYIVKSIKRGFDPEWDDSDFAGVENSLRITSEMIHRTLPSNQILRAWDNVPRVAKAQEVTGNRIVYGNYLQNYNVDTFVTVIQSLSSREHENSEGAFTPVKSIKSIRDYKIGVVFGDKYGRETPVIGMGGVAKTKTSSNTQLYKPMPGTSSSSVHVEKTFAPKINSLDAKLKWAGSPPSWVDYYKFYIKETTNEYYNLAMDRWYNAEDGNIWLSFQSADRNKLDIETYLILKNQHGTDDPVTEEARYKILAIENEAPDYIKTTNKILGEVKLSQVENVISTLAEMAVVVVESVQFKKIFVDPDRPAHEQFKGTGYIRIKGTWQNNVHYSNWTKISSMTGDGDSFRNITLAEDLGASADFVDTFGTSSDITIYAEFKDAVVENRPEFDGRFFVKIFKDAALSRNVLITSNALMEFTPIKSIKVFHLSNTKYNQANQNAIYQGNYTSEDNLPGPNVPYITDTGNNYTYSNGAANVTNYGADNDDNKSRWAWDVNTFPTTDDTWMYNNHGDHVSQLGTTCSDDHILQTGKFWHKFKDARQSSSDYAAGWFLDGMPTCTDDPVKGYVRKTKPFEEVPGVSGFGKMNFGRIHRDGEPLGNKQKLLVNSLVEGALFRFPADPMKVVYQVTSSSGPSNQGPYNVLQKRNAASTKCKRGDGDTSYGRRGKYSITFNRYDDPTAGLDTFTWDPRSAVRHDARDKNHDDTVAHTELTIHILDTFFNESESIETSQGNAIWETEPKEDVGLDLFYEATNALPMILKENNNESFAPLRSVVKCFDTGGNKQLALVDDALNEGNELVVDTIFRDVIGVRGIELNDPLPYKAKVGDVFSFTHGNGMITRSAIKDHWNALTSKDGEFKKSLEFTYNVTLDATGIGSISTSSVDSTNFTATPDGRIWEATSDAWGSDKRIFVTSIVHDGGTTSIHFVITQPTKYDQVMLPVLGINAWDTIFSSGVSAGAHDVTFKEITGYYRLDNKLWDNRVTLPWFNCYSFGNGLESDRIRDDFNAPQIDNGVKVSTTLESYEEERRGNSMIYSGIYNSTSGVNNLNEFNMAESITKDLNPMYGSIQALKTRDTNVVAFCEDKVFRILANKDALYNADGSANVTASNAVLGDATAFAGDFGISLNPESLAVDGYRMYFTDKQRNKVLRLSQDGLTPISDVGMRSWFREHLKPTHNLIGSFDEVKGEYNLSLTHKESYTTNVGNRVITVSDDLTDITVSFNEASKGWSSFKSFVPETGLSINDEYLTGKDARLWSHHSEVLKSQGPNLIANGTFNTANGWTVGRGGTQSVSTNTLVMTSGYDGETPMNALSKVDAIGRVGKRYKLTHSAYTFTGTNNGFIRLDGVYDADNIMSFTEGTVGVSTSITFTAYQDFSYIQYFCDGVDDSITIDNVSLVEVFDEPIKLANNFYGVQYDSTIDVLFNEMPGSVKSFNTINYEGTQAKVTSFATKSTTDAANNDLSLTDGEYYNLSDKDGWYVSSFTTDLQEGEVAEFIDKENKWFNNVTGVSTELSNLDTSEFSVQGIGVGTYGPPADIDTVTLTIKENND